MTTTALPSRTHMSYKTMSKQEQQQQQQQFYNDDIERFDADTIRNRYGDNWKNLATNVREVTQPDGSIVKEYFIEDPTLLENIQSSSAGQNRRKSSVNGSDDDEQYQPSRNRIAQIKAKFESNKFSNVMTSPATSSSATTANTNRSYQSSRKQIDDLYARHRRASNESLSIDRSNHESGNAMSKSNQSIQSQNTYLRSQSTESDRSKISSFRRFNSGDEADEEVSRIHRQGEELRRQHDHSNPTTTSRVPNNMPQQSNVEYEVVDEDGNPMAINGIQDLIKMSGVRAREVPQPDGTIIKEYVIDDPQLLSQVHSQQQQQSPINTSHVRQQQYQRSFDPDAPPPPPRIPLRPPILFRPGGSANNDKSSNHIQEIHVLDSQRRYEYLTGNGRRVQFSILNSNDFNRQPITDKDIRELSNAINIRLVPSSIPVNRQQKPSSPKQAPYYPPKPWYPAVDLPQRQRLASDDQSYSNNNRNIGFQQVQTDLSRSASSGALNQRSFHPTNQQQQQQPVFHQTQQDWNHYRNSNVRPQSSEPFQTSAQFLPQQQQQQQQQTTRSTYSPPMNHQQSVNYPYQGQQQHGVHLYNDYNQYRTAVVNNSNTRI